MMHQNLKQGLWRSANKRREWNDSYSTGPQPVVPRRSVVLCLLACVLTASVMGPSRRLAAGESEIIVVVGVGGTIEHQQRFARSAEKWRQVADAHQHQITILGHSDQHADPHAEPDETETVCRDRLLNLLARTEPAGTQPLWIVLIGHGTYDGRTARFNLVGPDLDSHQLAESLSRISRPTVIINTASCSGPFIADLSASHRTLVTATRSGFEQNVTRFGDYLSDSIGDLGCDLDADGEVSLREACSAAQRRTVDFYSGQGRIQSEHALLDDNGDGQGIAIGSLVDPDEHTDGLNAHQVSLAFDPARRRLTADQVRVRTRVERELRQLRTRRKELTEAEYYSQLERIVLPLSRIYAVAEANSDSPTLQSAP